MRKRTLRLCWKLGLCTFAAYNAVNERTCESFIKVYGVLDTAENRICLPSALGHTLQHLPAHCTTRKSSLGMGGNLTCWGTWSSAAFTKESAMVGFLRKQSWGRVGNKVERVESLCMGDQYLFTMMYSRVSR